MASASNQEENEIFENWEDLEDIEILDKKLDKIISSNKEENDLRNDEEYQNSKSIDMVILGEDEFRSHYGPTKPAIKILKRPNKNDCLNNNSSNDDEITNGISYNNLSNRSRQKKTLQQREEEYAKARIRILGSQIPDDFNGEDGEINVSSFLESPTFRLSVAKNLKLLNSNQNYELVKANLDDQNDDIDLDYEIEKLSLDYSHLDNSRKININLENSIEKNRINGIIRLPKGPDGTKGFNTPR